MTALIGVVVTCGTAYLLLRFFPSALFMGSWLACAIILLLLFNNGGVGGQKKVSTYIKNYRTLFIHCKKVQSNDTEMDIVSSLRL